MNTIVTDQTRSGIKMQTVTATVTFANATRAIYVGTLGDLAIRDTEGNALVIPDAANGYHPLETSGIDWTDTTAEGIVAIF
jgi:hypothetical protein